MSSWGSNQYPYWMLALQTEASAKMLAPKQTFKGRHTSVQMVHENCSAPLIIREIQIKSAMRNYFTLVILLLSKRQKIENMARIGRKVNPCTILVRKSIRVTHCGKLYGVVSKTNKQKLTVGLRVPVLGIFIQG